MADSRLIGVVCALTILGGCIAHRQYRTDTEVCVVTSTTTCDANALQEYANADGSTARLAFVEFDDQGQLWDRADAAKIDQAIWEIAQRDDLLILTFVHGWKHSAAPGDTDIDKLKKLALRLAAAEARIGAETGTPVRKVVAVYLAWRGGSLSVPLLKELTFWDRKGTAQEVGHGGMIDMLARLEQIRDARNKVAAGDRTKLIVVGHSFGGAVVFSALAQTLAERFVQTAGGPTVASDARGFGDLIVLINPAFEATLFAPLSDLSTERGSYFASQLPVLAILTSEADWATRYAFPAGRRFSTLLEKARDPRRFNATTRQFELIDADAANRTAVGHFSPYRTHRLYRRDNATREDFATYTAADAAETFYRTSIEWESDEPGSRIDFDGLTLERTMTSAARNPYLSIYVDGKLIRDHGDIDDPRVIRFVEQLVLISSQPENPAERSKMRK